MDHLCWSLVADRSRHELHRTPRSDPDPLHFLQLRLSYLLVDGVVLHPVYRHDAALLANFSRDSSEGAQVGRRVGFVAPAATAALRQDLTVLSLPLPRPGLTRTRRPSGRVRSRDRRASVSAPATASHLVQLREAGRTWS